MSSSLTALGVYLYAGGFAVGVRRAGFDVVAHLEGNNAYGAASARLNWPELPVHCGPNRWPLEELAAGSRLDFVFSNPPCAIFSSQGIVTTRGPESWKTDSRLQDWYDCVDVLEKLRPRAWALESVTQAYSRGRPLIDEITKRALVRGYSVTHLLLDAKWHGIPQSRRRFFVLAHGPAKLVGYAPRRNWGPPPTVGETLENVTEPGWAWELKPHLQRLVEATPPGELLCDTWDRITEDPERFRSARGLSGRPSFRHKRLSSVSQMGAYIAGDFYHPTENRVIGINESKALCGYPLDFQLEPPEKGWPALLARAVMPPVGEWLARAVASTLVQPDAAWADRRVTLIDVREPDRPEVDLTGQYLDENGRVRLRARTDGTVAWAGFSGPSSAPKRVNDRPAITVVEGLPKPPPPRVAAGVALNEVDRASAGSTASYLARGEGSVALPAHRPEPGEGSGKFLQRLWRTTDLSPDELVELVHGNYPNRTTKRGDVYYNYQALVKAGEAVRPWPGGGRTIAKRVDPRVNGERTSASANFRTALLTGSTPIQVGSNRVQLQIMSNQECWRDALTDLGYVVERRPVVPGEDLSRYDVVLSCLNKPNAIVSRHSHGALWALRSRPDAIATLDDWQTRQVLAGVRCYARDVIRMFRLHGTDVPSAVRTELFEFINRLATEPWPFPVVAPLFEGGDPALLGLPARVVPVDPTSYAKRYPVDPHGARARRWVQASLLLKGDPPPTSWPVARFGNAARGPGGVGTSANRAAEPRLAEAELMAEYAASWGVLSPAHDNAGSGWWRIRYLMAADAGCVLSASPAEAAVLGEPYVWAADPARVEALSDDELTGIAADQRELLGRIAWSRERVVEAFRSLIAERTS